MRIERLEIKSRNLTAQLKFYRDLLGVERCRYEENSFEVKMGYSMVKFVQDENATPYHIALHIPDKQEGQALTWIKERVPVLKNSNEEIIDFSGWNAKSVYFYDEDKNIMEFIARRNFFKPQSAIFSEESILGVAEVGLAVENIQQKYNFLKEKCGLEIFDGNFEKFCAIGDDEGLLITIDKNKKDWFPTDDKAYASSFRLTFSHSGHTSQIQFDGNNLSMTKI